MSSLFRGWPIMTNLIVTSGLYMRTHVKQDTPISGTYFCDVIWVYEIVPVLTRKDLHENHNFLSQVRNIM